MQKVAKYLVKSFKLPQPRSLEGPIIPKPGPILPIDDADIAKDDIMSDPFIEMTNAHIANINI